MIKDLNNTFIVLLPKKEEIKNFEDFRPISLCNTIYKIIAKVIANRLKNALNEVSSIEQSFFSLGRSICEGVIIAHEMIHPLG